MSGFHVLLLGKVMTETEFAKLLSTWHFLQMSFLANVINAFCDHTLSVLLRRSAVDEQDHDRTLHVTCYHLYTLSNVGSLTLQQIITLRSSSPS